MKIERLIDKNKKQNQIIILFTHISKNRKRNIVIVHRHAEITITFSFLFSVNFKLYCAVRFPTGGLRTPKGPWIDIRRYGVLFKVKISSEQPNLDQIMNKKKFLSSREVCQNQ